MSDLYRSNPAPTATTLPSDRYHHQGMQAPDATTAHPTTKTATTTGVSGSGLTATQSSKLNQASTTIAQSGVVVVDDSTVIASVWHRLQQQQSKPQQVGSVARSKDPVKLPALPGCDSKPIYASFKELNNNTLFATTTGSSVSKVLRPTKMDNQIEAEKKQQNTGRQPLRKQPNNVWSTQQSSQDSGKPAYKSTKLDDIDLSSSDTSDSDSSSSDSSAGSRRSGRDDALADERLIDVPQKQQVNGFDAMECSKNKPLPTLMTTKGGAAARQASAHSSKGSHATGKKPLVGHSNSNHAKISLNGDANRRNYSRSQSSLNHHNHNAGKQKNCTKNKPTTGNSLDWSRQSSEPMINDIIYSCDCDDCDQRRKLALAEVYRAMAQVGGSTGLLDSTKTMYSKTRFVHLILRSIILTLCTILLLLLLIGTIIVSHHLPQALDKMMNVSRSFNVTIAGRK